MSKEFLLELAKKDNYDLDYYFFDEIVYPEFRKAIHLALVEQDRDTRHLIAEKINQLALDDTTIKAAHNIAMNTSALPEEI